MKNAEIDKTLRQVHETPGRLPEFKFSKKVALQENYREKVGLTIIRHPI